MLVIVLSTFSFFLHLGLILITSDGRLPNSVLRGQAKQPKTYQVSVDHKLRSDDLEKLRVRIIDVRCILSFFRIVKFLKNIDLLMTVPVILTFFLTQHVHWHSIIIH